MGRRKGMGENSKKAQGQARKAQQKAERRERENAKKEADEAASWQEGANRRGARRAEQSEAKRAAQEAKRAARRQAELDDLKAVAGIKTVKRNPHATAHSRPARGAAKKAERMEAKVEAASREREREAAVEVVEASGIDGALGALAGAGGGNAEPERHPERRMRAAYAAYEERMMPVLREEHPGLKRSQYKERLFQRWQKAPENPMNQAHVAHNAPRG